MKNPTINIFIENIYEEFGFDEVEFHNDVQKMLKFAIELPEVKENCCLTGKDFSTLVFDIVLCNILLDGGGQVSVKLLGLP